ncbi:hypothetical protein [Marinibactrum halimedae]|nr:hypothetical protein [Marinibactrum halimedae]MCD9459238.1 hypothetical protein [Marinibactrum halimedae]
MKVVEFQTQSKPDMATVNIVRRAVFYGDGVKVEAWDGEKFIGTLGPGELLQYQAEPGMHTFLASMKHSWAVAQGELEAGKTYYLKFNMSGWSAVNLGVAKPTDPRIPEWNRMTTIIIDESDPKPVAQKYISRAQRILKKVEDGTAIITPITDANAM